LDLDNIASFIKIKSGLILFLFIKVLLLSLLLLLLFHHMTFKKTSFNIEVEKGFKRIFENVVVVAFQIAFHFKTH